MMIVIYVVKPNKQAEGSRHMKVSREQAAENRARVIEVAGRLFRERGFDGVGVADIMKGAGLTHGGFYGQFASKDDLAAQACAQTLDRSVAASCSPRPSARAVRRSRAALTRAPALFRSSGDSHSYQYPSLASETEAAPSSPIRHT